jgi:hypothetical protein
VFDKGLCTLNLGQSFAKQACGAHMEAEEKHKMRRSTLRADTWRSGPLACERERAAGL